jgi:hypothetical protein
MLKREKRPLRVDFRTKDWACSQRPGGPGGQHPTIDFCCGRCGAMLLHAEEEQVYGLLIRRSDCGSYNSTD